MKLILLCGGRSERMGEPKGLLPLPGGSFFISEQCRSFFRAGGVDITVVLGFNAEKYINSLHCFRNEVGEFVFDCYGDRVNCVINENPQRGPFSSLLSGISSFYKTGTDKKKLPATSETGVFVLPVDVPCPGTGVFMALNRALVSGIKVCMPILNGRGGHPVLLEEDFCRFLLSVEQGDNYRLDRQINLLLPREIKRVDVQEACVCYNLNRPEDWQRYLSERRDLK